MELNYHNTRLIFVIFLAFCISCEDNDSEDNNSDVNCDIYSDRGNLVSYDQIVEFNKEAFEIVIKNIYGFDPNVFDIQNPVKVYKIIYESIGVDGKPTELSGAVYVPQLEEKRALPTLKISHYTITERDAVASVRPNVSPQSLLGSMQGYFAIYADGIGFGISETQAPFVNKRLSAISGIDLLRASKEFACENGIELNDQLFTTGYSAGGYGTMAFHQILEEEYSDEFTVTANAPLAGPYSLPEMATRIFTDGIYKQPYYLGFALWGYMLGTGDYESLNRWVKPQFREAIMTMYDGNYSGGQINSALNDTMSILLDPSFLSNFLGNGEIEFKNYLKKNSFIYDGWVPKAPIHFMHGEDDITVFYSQMELGNNALIADGASNIQTSTYPGDHGGAVADCMINSIKWFNTIKK